jgi:hypothetical protein
MGLMTWEVLSQGVTNLSPLKESRPRDSRLASKEFGILGHQIIFTLPGCFFLRVVISSDFAHSDSFPLGDFVCSLKNLRWLQMLCLDSLTTITYGHMLCDLSFHSVPPEFPLQILICHTRALRDKAGCISYMRQRRQHI